MTTIKIETLQEVLEEANPNRLPDALRKVGGKHFGVIKLVATGVTAAASFDVTSAAFRALIAAGSVVVSGVALETAELLPPIGDVVNCRVSASGTATSVGSYILGDAAATMIVPPGGASVAVGIGRISDDGKTITFPNTVTGFVLTYRPRSAVPLTDVFAPVA